MLLIIQSILVYGFMIWVMTYFGVVAYKAQYPQGYGAVNRLGNKKVNYLAILSKSYFLIPILVFCFFAAIRYRVGVDCETYKEIFYDINHYGISLVAQNIEVGYVYLSKLTYSVTGSHYLLFFILAFLQIVFYYIALQKERHALIFLGIAIMLTGHYWSLMNGMRQNVAACAFVAMIPFVINNKWLYFVAGVMLATTMHRSASLLLPIGVLAYFLRNGILNKYMQLAILALSYLCMNKFDNVFSENIMSFAVDSGYEDSEVSTYTEHEATTYKFGLRMYLLYLVYCLVILFSDKMYRFFKSKSFNTMYNLFFIAICLTLIFYNNFTVKRLIYYFTCFTPVIVSYFMFYLWKTKKRELLFFTIIILLVQVIWSVHSDITQKGPFEPMLYKFDFN